MIELLLEAARLKHVARAGWLRHDVANPESVAAHSWGIGWLVLLFLPPDLNRERALSYAVVHDLAEVRVGDITPHDGISTQDKQALELSALHGLLRDAPQSVQDTALAYQRGADAEARFVKELDRLDMAIQATVYAQETGRDLREFMVSARRALTTPVLIEVWERLNEQHPLAKD